MADIQWSKFSNYFSMDEGTDYYLILKNWRQHEKEYNGRLKFVLSFDVSDCNDVAIDYPLVFTVSGGNAVRFRPMIERAEKMGKDYIYVCVNRDKNKKIDVADMNIVKKIVEKR